jgi:hypothetical protein
MRRIVLRFACAASVIAAVTAVIATAPPSAFGDEQTLRETIYMSRSCESGWYLESRDGNRIVMACDIYSDEK